VKRGLDAVVAGAALIVLSPLLVLIGLAIRLDSPGPPLFLQQRIGRFSQPFAMYKFRTMRQGTPEMSKEALLQGGGAAAVTRVGSFLRRASFDELPQFLNVLLGQMSVVGPRPALYNQYDLIAARQEAGVDELFPGITGYAQVMGREDLLLDEKVAFDRYYVRHVSLWLDVKIFILTFYALITAKGAY
jgi:lipopolysaccharide/colanic/teichoic acid biosynthesis glycosyltransferase